MLCSVASLVLDLQFLADLNRKNVRYVVAIALIDRDRGRWEPGTIFLPVRR